MSLKKTLLSKKISSFFTETEDFYEKRLKEIEQRLELVEEENDDLRESLSIKNELIDRLNKRIAVCESTTNVISNDLLSTLYILGEIQSAIETAVSSKKETYH